MSAGRVFRNSSYALVAMIVVLGFAVDSTLPDGADWAERLVAWSSAVAPWLVSAMIVWAAGEIVKAIRYQGSGDGGSGDQADRG